GCSRRVIGRTDARPAGTRGLERDDSRDPQHRRSDYRPMSFPHPPTPASIARRQFFGRTATGIGAAALASLLNPRLFASPGTLAAPHFAPKAKRVIYLFMHGGPSQLDLFDHKPGLRA